MSIHKLIHPVLLKLSKNKMEYELRVINTYDMHSEKPIIFAVNHTNSSDIPMVCNAIKRHSYNNAFLFRGNERWWKGR